MSRKEKSKLGRIYNHRPDTLDIRDLAYRPKLIMAEAHIPESTDLENKLPSCWDQLDLGACTGHGSIGAMVFIHPDKMFSRLKAYYNGRVIEGDVCEDNGAQIRDVVQGLAQAGVCEETQWPYNTDTFASPPPIVTENSAFETKISQYLRVSDIEDYKQCLAEGFPVILGFTVYSNFESEEMTQSGILTLPGTNDSVLGGHCVLGIGYDETTRRAKIRNSWGTGWGPFSGNFFMDYDYFTNLVSDMWTIRS